MLGSLQAGVQGHTLRCDILRANPSDESSIGDVLCSPRRDGRGSLRSQAISPGGWIEPVKQVHDIPVVKPYDLDTAKPNWLFATTAPNDPVAEAEPTPMLIPLPKELAGLIASHQSIRWVVRAGADIAIDREDRIYVRWCWPTQG